MVGFRDRINNLLVPVVSANKVRIFITWSAENGQNLRGRKRFSQIVRSEESYAFVDAIRENRGVKKKRKSHSDAL